MNAKTATITDTPTLSALARQAGAAPTVARKPAPQNRVTAVAGAARYLQPGLIPVAAAVWLHNLLALLR